MKQLNTDSEFRLLNKSEAAKILGIGRDRLVELIETGKIKYLNLGKGIRIPQFELKRFVTENLLEYKKENITDEDIFVDMSSMKNENNFNSNNYLQNLLKEN